MGVGRTQRPPLLPVGPDPLGEGDLGLSNGAPFDGSSHGAGLTACAEDPVSQGGEGGARPSSARAAGRQ